MKITYHFPVQIIFILLSSAVVFAQWQQLNFPVESDVQCFAVDSGSNGINSPIIFAGTWGNGVLRSSDNGGSWTQINEGLSDMFVYSLAVTPNANGTTGCHLYAGTDFGIFLSTNSGTNWVEIDSGLTNMTIYSIAALDTIIIAGTNGDGVFRSANNGKSWSHIDSVVAGMFVYSIFILPSYSGTDGSNIFAGTWGNGVFLSTDKGISWTPASTKTSVAYTRHINSLVGCSTREGTNLFAAGAGNGIFRTTNNGTTWTIKNNGLENREVISLAISTSSADTILLVTTWGGGIFLSNNNGANWNTVNTGLSDMFVRTICISQCRSGNNEKYIFAGTNDHSVWRRPLSEVLTSVKSSSHNNPSRFILEQNYPNPFNPSTVISFTLPIKSYVSLKIFDIMGREVVTLVDETLSAGNYTQQWNAVNMSSGVYFYRLSTSPSAKRGEQAGSFVETKKLVLLR